MKELSKKKVGIFTTFYNYDRAYSIVSVVHDQLCAHIRNGYEPVLFVLESFEDDAEVPEGVEIRKVIPQIILEPYQGQGVPDSIEEDVSKVEIAIRTHAKDIDIMLTHDIIFIDTYLPYNMALRRADLPCRYFHWIHSAPSPRPHLEDSHHANRYTLPPNSKLVYLNNEKAQALAEMYGTYLRNVRVISNSRDPRTFWNMDEVTAQIIDKTNLLEADVISVYPVSTPRMVDGKQIDVVIKIHQALQSLGLKTRLIVPNAHANGEREKKMVEERHSPDVFFTSMLGYEHGVPQEVVSNLFRLSNVFIFPSISENCSLILLEAMLSGNLLVLNEDCSGMREFGRDHALYFKFGNLDMGIRNEENALQINTYLLDIAKIIRSELSASKPLKAKRYALQEHNIDTMFDKIENLYYERS